MSTIEMTVREMSDSITGYDERAILQHLGTDLYEAFKGPMTPWRRCLVFAHKRRQEGVNDAQAAEAAMSMSMSDILDYFAEPPIEEDEDDDEPESDAGKGSEPSGSQLTISPPSASSPE